MTEQRRRELDALLDELAATDPDELTARRRVLRNVHVITGATYREVGDGATEDHYLSDLLWSLP